MEDADEQVLNHWMAYHRLEPFGGEQELLASMCGMLWHLCMREADKPKELAERLSELKASFMPGDWIGHKQPANNQGEGKIATTAEEHFAGPMAQVQRAFG